MCFVANKLILNYNQHLSLLLEIDMKHLIVTASIFCALLVSGCATTGAYTRTGGGWISSFKEVQSVTSSSKANKRGEACALNILGVAVGDASVETAKRNGGITTVSSVDSDITNILYVYGKNCTIVLGD